MFLFIKDLINKIKTDEDDNKENIENNPSDIEKADGIVSEENRDEIEETNASAENEEQDINKNKNKKRKKKEKKKRKNKKARKKLLKPIGIAVLSIFMIFCISRILVLTSTKEYLFNGNIYYNASVQKYQISYEIEELWNGGNFQVGEKVCVPDYLTAEDSLTRYEYTDCIEGKIVEAGNKVKIQYELPKYVSYDELRLYIDKADLNKNFGKIYVRMKVYGDLKQIVEITPRK